MKKEYIVSVIIVMISMIPNITNAGNQTSYTITLQQTQILSPAKDKVELLFRKVWQEPDSSELTDKLGVILNQFQKKGYKILHDYDNLKLTSCYVEQTHYNSIFPDGTVDKCSNKDIGETRGYLSGNGEIIWHTIPGENGTNVFNFPSDCRECVYLPLCMGPCPQNRGKLLSGNKIRCHHVNKDQVFLDDIRNFTIIKGQ